MGETNKMSKKKKTKTQLVASAKITRTYGPFGRRVLSANGTLELVEQPEPKQGKRRKPSRYKLLKPLPDADKFREMRDQHFTDFVAGRVGNAVETIESLRDELDEWHSNMDGTGLENTEKYQQLEDAVEQLEAACSALEDQDAPEIVASLPVIVLPTTRKRRCPYSRPNQQADTLSELGAVRDTLDEFCDHKGITEETKQEVQDYVGQIDTAIDELEAVEFPGMY